MKEMLKNVWSRNPSRPFHGPGRVNSTSKVGIVHINIDSDWYNFEIVKAIFMGMSDN